MHLAVRTIAAAIMVTFGAVAAAAPVEPVMQQARANQQPLLGTLQQLVEIESGSGDREGLDRISQLVSDKLKALGGAVEFIEPGADAYRMEDSPEKIGRMVKATFKGTGTKKILLIAHMDTVYKRGMLARQPFRVEGDKAYGLGIADDKQGIAEIIHIVAMLNALQFRDYGTLTVLINGDEEVSSPGARAEITKSGAAHDVTMSFEGTRVNSDKLSLATSGIGGVIIKVKGKASHAGSAPERGINALVELSHQILQMKDMSDPKTGLKMNWTMSSAGNGSHNVIPEHAEAFADVRVNRLDDYDRIEREVREKIRTQLVPNAKVELVFERRRPPLQPSDAGKALGAHAQEIYRELGKQLVVDEKAEGGGTDAAFAALQTKNAVLERFGLAGFGAHSTEDEYVLVSSIEPRLYLATRLIMDVSQGKVR
ncbi:MAG TPA: glutamate carboxypeptidase [Usitatibacter sp.]|jgi:glutamate carboxypeptidase|nr:glutamate carboxypeptidase [Usitatibacter sp.]